MKIHGMNYALLSVSGSAHCGLPEQNKPLFSPEAEKGRARKQIKTISHTGGDHHEIL